MSASRFNCTYITLLNSPRWLNTMTGDETGLASQLISTPSLRTQPMKGCTTPLESTPPTLYEQQCGFFYVPQESEQWESCETGPTVYRPYPSRLECLAICRCHNKGSTFSSVILRPCVLVGPGLKPVTFRSADRGLSNRANQVAVTCRLVMIDLLFDPAIPRVKWDIHCETTNCTCW